MISVTWVKLLQYLLRPWKQIVTYWSSLHRKCFCLVSEQRKTEERDFRFWPSQKWNESQRMKEGEGEGQTCYCSIMMSVRKLRHDRPSGRFLKSQGLSANVSFLSSQSPAGSFTCATVRMVFDSRFSFFAPKPHGNTGYAGYYKKWNRFRLAEQQSRFFVVRLWRASAQFHVLSRSETHDDFLYSFPELWYSSLEFN